jgi:flagellar hook-associated protein 1
MSGIGLVLNLAKDAILSQQYAIDVVSHNIANVSTEGYTRQVPMLEAQDAAPYGGHLFGRGVKLSDIESVANAFIERRLQSATSNLSMMSEKETYMNIMETIFTENSSSSISNQFNEFWNALNDLNNNPSGIPERNILTEYGSLLAQSFQDTSSDLLNLSKEVNKSIEVGVNDINQILDQIADTNKQILLVKTTGTPNDLIDKRNLLVKNLSEYLDVNVYEYDDGSITVNTNKGFVLVNKQAAYHLDFDGIDITWSNNSSPITDDINGGKLGGWLDIRDEIIPKYKSDLDELAKSTIWEINSLHSQGVGLTGFTSVTGTYDVDDSSEEMGTIDSGLDFYDKIKDGSFKIWLYDTTGAVVGESTIAVDADTTTLGDIAAVIDGLSIGGQDAFNSSIKNGLLNIEIDPATSSGYTFAFSDDSSNILATLGINTFFTSSNARDMGINDMIIADKNYIAAGTISNNVGNAVGAASNTSTGIITTSGPYTGTSDASFEIEILNPGAGTFRWRKDSGAWTNAAMGSSVALGEGVTATFNGTIATDYGAGDTFTINVENSSDAYGDFYPGDNTNSLELANLQYENVSVKKWVYSRASTPTSLDVTNITLDDYFHQMVGSIGIQSQSVQREKAYTQTIQQEMQTTRDNISAVSLDEEMTNLIKYQHAYMAAAKLITTAQEMLDEILQAVK